MPDNTRPQALRMFAGLSRRQLFRSVAIAIGGAALLAESSTPALALMPQKAAGYQDKPKGKQMCSNCSHFEPPSSCGLVAGKISPNGWCRFYAQKS
ncbi:MAG TPA: high potential iron sulfur protein [Xanthobacteraceae bacterium]|nr:high potential iron sulfur protein [Xanthobacteraceae bacterium]